MVWIIITYDGMRIACCCYVAIVEGVVDTSTIATSRQEREVAEETNAGKRYLFLRFMIQERQLVSFGIKKAVVVCGFYVFASRSCEGCITVYLKISSRGQPSKPYL
jgi:hypothetical protein